MWDANDFELVLIMNIISEENNIKAPIQNVDRMLSTQISLGAKRNKMAKLNNFDWRKFYLTFILRRM